MRRIGCVSALLFAAAMALGAGCDKGPEPRTEFTENADVGEKDVEYQYKCEGLDLAKGESPKIDVALEVTEKQTADGGKRILFNVTAVEEHGWAVCTVNVEVWHKRLNEETKKWERDGLPASFTVPRIDFGPEPTKFQTAMATGEFVGAEVTEAGPPEAWGWRVRDWQIVKKPPI